MSTEIQTQPELQTELPPSGLPSDVADNQTDFSGFELNEDIKSKFKDGKLNGRFSSLDDVLTKLKESEDRYANLMRDQKNELNNQEQQVQQQQQVQVQQETINKYIPEFIANGMQLTPEMEKAITDTGIDIRDLKLGAIEVKEKIQAAHNVVGGADEYNAMLTWGKENMTEAQKKAFDADVTNPTVSEYAIKGLYADYKASNTEQEPYSRVEGQPANVTIKPYKDMGELLKDKRYLSTPKGKNDVAANKQYQARLSVTPDNVWSGR